MKSFKALWAPLLTLLSLQSSSAAMLTYNGPDYTKGMDITLLVDSNTVTYFSGMANIVVDGISLNAFCADIDVTIANGGPYPMQVLTSASLNQGGRVGWLMANMMSSVINSVTAAGMGLALWDIIEDNGDGLNLGRIMTAPATDIGVIAAAQDFLNQSAGKSLIAGTVFMHIDGPQVTQTLIVPPASIPEPATIGVAGAALLALGLIARRRAAK